MIAWAPGSQIGPYELVDPIGVGGMGEVWKARDTRLGRVVAIKRLTGQHTARFEQEARAIASLNHPHICVLFDVGPDYLVMEYIDGRPLRGPLPLSEALVLAGQIADALSAAHKKGVLHRDLKPANILIGATGAKLLDFGLAKLASAADTDVTKTSEGMILGTAAYMSPEQAQAKPLDERSDIFSFGAVLYEMLSGQPAFPGDSMVDILSAVVRDQPKPLALPPAVAEVVSKCLAKNPEARFQNMAEVKAALGTSSSEMRPSPAAKETQSIAVLPFANMSADKEQEYFSDGLTEEIISALAHIPELKVAARTSAFAFRGKEQDITQIAQALNVRTILEGSVRKAGNRVRITAQLINAADGYHLWSQRFDGDLNDVFTLQDEIAASIASALRVKFAGHAPRAYQPSLPAYEAFLRGRYHLLRNNPDSLEIARLSFEQAIRLDPGYAAPRAELGIRYYLLAAWGTRPTNEVVPLAREQAMRALELSPDEPQAHVVLGGIAAMVDHDWAVAKRHFDKLLAVEPIPPDGLVRYGFFYLCPTGRAEESLAHVKKLLADDPLNNLWHAAACALCSYTGRFQEAVEAGNRAYALNPHALMTLFFLSSAQVMLGQFASAKERLEDLGRMIPWHQGLGLMAYVCEQLGEDARAREIVASLEASLDRTNAPLCLAMYHSLRGDVDLAAEMYLRSLAQKDLLAVTLIRWPVCAGLRSSKRWPEFLRVLNLPA